MPNVDESTLQSGTTATYMHRKDPLIVSTGDTVTYRITIYNEGDKSGKATEVIDQLPEGLRFSRVVSGNYELGSYDEDTNTLTLNATDALENIPAYTQG